MFLVERNKLAVITGIFIVNILIFGGIFLFFIKSDIKKDEEHIDAQNLPRASDTRKKDEDQSRFAVFSNFARKTLLTRNSDNSITEERDESLSNNSGFKGSDSNYNVDNTTKAPLSSDIKKEEKTPSTRSYEDVFNLLWPPSYIDAVKDIEKMMVGDGFIPESAKHSDITTDEDVFEILVGITEYATTKGWISAEIRTRYINSIRTEFTLLIKSERNNYTNGISKTPNMSDLYIIVQSVPDKQRAVETILDRLLYVFLVRSAEAQTVDGGNWVSEGDCYKDLIPSFPIPGHNVFAFCCNCGLDGNSNFVEDCKEHSAQCVIPLGCLNLACGGWPNAIWDPETGICGCG